MEILNIIIYGAGVWFLFCVTGFLIVATVKLFMNLIRKIYACILIEPEKPILLGEGKMKNEEMRG